MGGVAEPPVATVAPARHDGGMRDPLDDRAVTEALRGLDGWTRDGAPGGTAALRRTAALPSFPLAIEAVRRVGEAAESLDHHPDIDIRWRRVTFACSTHSAGGRITELDVALAQRIDAVLAELGASPG